VFAAYLVATLLAAVLTGLAAVANLTGHDYPKSQADRMRLSYSWMLPLGGLLAAGSAGLLAGFAVPVLGLLAAAGLVVYFLGALGAHLRVGDRQLAGWALFFGSAVAAFATNLAYHGSWPSP
jgi:DoxX-like family